MLDRHRLLVVGQRIRRNTIDHAAASDPARSPPTAASCRATAPPPGTATTPATRRTTPSATRRPPARPHNPTAATTPAAGSTAVPPPVLVAPTALGLRDRPPRRAIRPLIAHRDQHPMHHISPHRRAGAIDQLIDLRRERVNQRPLPRPCRQPATRRVPRRDQPRDRLVITPRQRRRSTQRARQRHTPQGSPSLPPVSSQPPSSDRALTTTRARVPAPQDRTVGRNRGHPWGETVATSGEIRWPPMGSFPWPPSPRYRSLASRAPDMWESHRPNSVRGGLHAMPPSLVWDQLVTGRTPCPTPTIHGHHLMPPLRHATVADAMHPGIVSCPADATLTDVARLMATHHVHCIAVIGGSHDQQGERLVGGLISDLDVMRAGIRVGPEESAAALALEPMISVDATTGLSEARRAHAQAWRQRHRGDRLRDPAADGGPARLSTSSACSRGPRHDRGSECMFGKIVIGVDGRQGGRDAIALARHLASPDASFTLVYVYGRGPISWWRHQLGEERPFDREATMLATERERAGIQAGIACVPGASPAAGLHDLAEHDRGRSDRGWCLEAHAARTGAPRRRCQCLAPRSALPDRSRTARLHQECLPLLEIGATSES